MSKVVKIETFRDYQDLIRRVLLLEELTINLPSSVVWILIVINRFLKEVARNFPSLMNLLKQAGMIILIVMIDGTLDILTLAGDVGSHH